MITYKGDNRRIALIPAYKPEEKLIELSRSLFEIGFRVVIVNDGSGKEYDDVFRKAAEYALILRHKVCLFLRITLLLLTQTVNIR